MKAHPFVHNSLLAQQHSPFLFLVKSFDTPLVPNMFFLSEIAVWLLWWIIFNTYQTILKIFFTILPISLLKKAVTEQFEGIGIKVTSDPKLAGKYDENKFDCEVVVHNDYFFRRVAAEDYLSMGEWRIIHGRLVRLSNAARERLCTAFLFVHASLLHDSSCCCARTLHQQV